MRRQTRKQLHTVIFQRLDMLLLLFGRLTVKLRKLSVLIVRIIIKKYILEFCYR